MKKIKLLFPIILATLIGLYLGRLIYNGYQNKLNLEQSFNEKNTVYYIQQGVYSTKESMLENASQLSNYIYMSNSNKYYVYVGITTDVDVANKLKGIYSDKGIDLYRKEEVIENNSFYEKLKEYDKLIINSNDDNEILDVENQVLKEYEVLENGQ